jgi:hypothetical protein
MFKFYDIGPNNVTNIFAVELHFLSFIVKLIWSRKSISKCGHVVLVYRYEDKSNNRLGPTVCTGFVFPRSMFSPCGKLSTSEKNHEMLGREVKKYLITLISLQSPQPLNCACSSTFHISYDRIP